MSTTGQPVRAASPSTSAVSSDLDVGGHAGDPGERAAHDQLVLRVQQGVGPGMDRDALGHECAQQLARDTFVVEGHALGIAGKTAQRVEVVGLPGPTSAQTSAAGSPGEAASTRSDWPSAIAAWCDIRASCPPPTIPTTGRRSGAGVAASTV